MITNIFQSPKHSGECQTFKLMSEGSMDPLRKWQLRLPVSVCVVLTQRTQVHQLVTTLTQVHQLVTTLTQVHQIVTTLSYSGAPNCHNSVLLKCTKLSHCQAQEYTNLSYSGAPNCHTVTHKSTQTCLTRATRQKSGPRPFIIRANGNGSIRIRCLIQVTVRLPQNQTKYFIVTWLYSHMIKPSLICQPDIKGH